MQSFKNELSADYRELVETASLDWQVGQYFWHLDKETRHSDYRAIAEAIAEIGREQHGPAFDKAAAAYRAE